MSAFVVVVGLVLGFASPAMTQLVQEAQAVLGQDTARVGDVVPVAVRVVTGPGERVAWPDTLPLAGSPAENAAGVREQVDTVADGRVVRTGVYAVTPWRTGALELPEVAVSVVGGDESPRTVRSELPVLTVVSVLPPDTTGVEPQPARGVLGASWAWGTIVLLVVLAALLVSGLVWWWRRRRSAVTEDAAPWAPAVPPRERALAALREAREAGFVERSEWKAFYTRVSEAVRAYAAALEGSWGEDLATTELLGRFWARVGAAEAATLADVLRSA
ncbi:MAG: hypothetical protein R6U63_06315, partial [Longimicrobiales bacterium]